MIADISTGCTNEKGGTLGPAFHVSRLRRHPNRRERRFVFPHAPNAVVTVVVTSAVTLAVIAVVQALRWVESPPYWPQN
jgi:hypothetical protein